MNWTVLPTRLTKKKWVPWVVVAEPVAGAGTMTVDVPKAATVA